ncbi:MAG: hypothetical protein ACFFBP_08850 [Promethearchaeota archaeon]
MVGYILTIPDMISGISTLIFLIISMSIGLLIILKYFKFKSKSFLFIGLAFFGLYFHYIPVVVNVIYTFLTQDLINEVEFNLLLGFTPMPFFVIFWYLGFTELAFENKRKIFMTIIVIWSIIFIIIFFGLIFTNNASTLASVVNPVKMTFQPPFIALTTIFLILILIPYVLLAIEGLKTNSPEFKLKGYLILIGFILYPLGTVIDLLSGGIILFILLARIIGIVSAIIFYLGLFLPERVKKIFIK